MQAKASAPLDLTRDNRIRRLLEERERQAAIIRKAKLIKDEAEAEIREKLGEAEEAFTDEWQITIRTVHRREFTVPAAIYTTRRARAWNRSERKRRRRGAQADGDARRGAWSRPKPLPNRRAGGLGSGPKGGRLY
jgi:hypothetical protein